MYRFLGCGRWFGQVARVVGVGILLTALQVEASGLSSNWVQTGTFQMSSTLDAFGDAVALQGTTMVAMAPNIFPHIPPSMYVFNETGTNWQLTQSVSMSNIINQSGMVTFQNSDSSVALCGGTMVVGMSSIYTNNYSSISGYADILNRQGANWAQSASLSMVAGGQYSFGSSVALTDRGTRLMIGANWQDSVSFYDLVGSSWVPRGTISGNSGSKFGDQVAIDGDWAIVGAQTAYPRAAYVCNWNGGSWQQNTTLLATTNSDGYNFGRSVGISGDYAAVANGWGGQSPYKIVGTTNFGVRIYHYDGAHWLSQAMLGFGGPNVTNMCLALALQGSRLAAVMCPTVNGSNLNVICVYDRTGTNWVCTAAWTNSNSQCCCVALDGNRLVVGAGGGGGIGPAPGVVYTYEIPALTITPPQTGNLHFTPGTSASLTWTNEPGITYEVLTTTNLQQGFVTVATNNVQGLLGTNSVTIPIDSAPSRYFKVVVQ